jgi:hypothetical protein
VCTYITGSYNQLRRNSNSMNKNDILTQCGSIKSPDGSHLLAL